MFRLYRHKCSVVVQSQVCLWTWITACVGSRSNNVPTQNNWLVAHIPVSELIRTPTHTYLDDQIGPETWSHQCICIAVCPVQSSQNRRADRVPAGSIMVLSLCIISNTKDLWPTCYTTVWFHTYRCRSYPALNISGVVAYTILCLSEGAPAVWTGTPLSVVLLPMTPTHLSPNTHWSIIPANTSLKIKQNSLVK